MLIANKVNRGSGNEEMVVGIGGTNYKFIFYRKCNWNHKRLSRISSWRWEMYEITAEKFKSSLEGYRFIEVERKTILEICHFWKIYLKNRGIENPELFGDVIEEDESQDS